MWVALRPWRDPSYVEKFGFMTTLPLSLTRLTEFYTSDELVEQRLKAKFLWRLILSVFSEVGFYFGYMSVSYPGKLASLMVEDPAERAKYGDDIVSDMTSWKTVEDMTVAPWAAMNR